MQIKKVIVGNKEEAFIESRFTQGINIISSDDNNKGKTIVIQSIMYAMGNDPIFPSSFLFQEYYHIVEFEINDEKIKVCRKKDTFIVIKKGNLYVHDSLNEFKRFINKNVFKLPIIIKNRSKKIVDPVLFFQMFFVGQDKKNTSNIFNNGYYNKEDFINMLYSYSNIPLFIDNDVNQDEIKKKILALKEEKKLLKKENKILRSKTDVARIVNMSTDREHLEEILNKIEGLKNSIIDLKKNRNRSIIRKMKNEMTLKELNSLNQALSVGELHCLDCDSTNIGYSTKDNNCTFDISSIEIRNQIKNSIKEKIDSYIEEIEDITEDINKKQIELKNLLEVDDISLESILFMKNDINSASNVDERLILIDKEIDELKESIQINVNDMEEVEKQKKKLYKSLSDKMYEVYKNIDPNGNLKFDGLFSKRGDVYSGSEGNEYYIAKMCAFAQVLKHDYPIIIDCYRDGELSSAKEDRLLNLIKDFRNQIILTVTLKEQEKGKYSSLKYINQISYNNHEICKLLKQQYVKELKRELEDFAIIL
ncbi:coiled-coil domain-containing protein [Clostridium sporogenes]|uniref:coiled-coil domain-containing protein n=1 Tax=Clostridium sporogenes TaxID=1509 RepID=UPI0001794BA2|nr:hypothetical protein [Clostridium sporogenes]EDU36663.1 hypothetical protein CLOSPO_02831 [Clostridium sporogenes ATCC 15579]NFE66684.1 hypothetical protein [Clostridium sporogenes]